MDWYKAYHGLPYDARLAVIARRANIARAEALALWLAVLDRASRNRPRGHLGAVEPEDLAIPLDIEPENAARALQAFRDKGMITKHGDIRGWDKLQPGSTARVRSHRLRRAAEQAAQDKARTKPAARNSTDEDDGGDLPPLSVFAQAPPLPPDSPAEIARRRARLQRSLQNKRRAARPSQPPA